MQMILIWYLFEDFDDNDQPIPAAIDNELNDRFEGFGFQVHEVTTPTQFRNVLQNILAENTLIHIFTHGANDVVAPFNSEQETSWRRQGITIDINDYFVTYDEIEQDLSHIYPEHQLILNLMAVCSSANNTIPASLKLACAGLNRNFLDSLEIYPLDTDTIVGHIDRLNLRNGQANGTYTIVMA